MTYAYFYATTAIFSPKLKEIRSLKKKKKATYTTLPSFLNILPETQGKAKVL